MYKQGNVKEAIVLEVKALEMNEKANDIRSNLDKMKKAFIRGKPTQNNFFDIRMTFLVSCLVAFHYLLYRLF